MSDTREPCPCCGHEPEDYGHRETMAWFEEQARIGNTVKVAMFTSGATHSPVVPSPYAADEPTRAKPHGPAEPPHGCE